MSLAWGPRLTAGSLSWGAREASATEGVINGTAEVLDSVESDLALLWYVNGAVQSDLNLLYQVEADPITAVESDLTLTWQLDVAAATSVTRNLELLWQRGGSVTTNLYLEWSIVIYGVVTGIQITESTNVVSLSDSRNSIGARDSYNEINLRIAA